MPKLIQAASALALAAATTTAFAWYAAPYSAPTQEQHKAMVEQQQAMMEQQTKAMREAFEAQRKFAEQQIAQFQEMQAKQPALAPFPAHPFAAAPTFPEVPPVPEFGQYPEMPKWPELGQFPSVPEMPSAPAFERPALPESVQERIKEMDAYREQARQQSEERRAAMKNWSEQRRAMHPHHAPGMTALPAPQQQAAAPSAKSTAAQ